MYLDAMFSISTEGIEIMRNMGTKRRLDYVLGLDSDVSFTDYMINIADYGEKASFFYSVLKLPELNLIELNYENMELLYKDDNFTILLLDKFKVKNISLKLDTINMNYFNVASLIAEEIGEKSFYTEEEKFLEFKKITKEAYKSDANLLFIMRSF